MAVVRPHREKPHACGEAGGRRVRSRECGADRESGEAGRPGDVLTIGLQREVKVLRILANAERRGLIPKRACSILI
jgi:hypothetical protein